MKLTKLSKNFAPIHRGIFFGIDTESDTPTNLIVEVIDTDTDTVVATQQLRKVTSAKVNIAPYIRFAKRYAPSTSSHTTFASIPNASYKIRIGDSESEAVLVSVNRNEVVSTPTANAGNTFRRIAHGERDEILVVAEPNTTLQADITSDRGEVLSVECNTNEGATALLIATEEFNAETKSLDVTIRCDTAKLATLHYTVTSPPPTATRLAWYSADGSIERYTFPIAHKRVRKVDRSCIATSEGYISTPCRTTQTLSLCSHLEPHATIEALSQIISSPRVWIERGNELESVEIATSVVEQNLFGEPTRITLEICTEQEENIALW